MRKHGFRAALKFAGPKYRKAIIIAVTLEYAEFQTSIRTHDSQFMSIGTNYLKFAAEQPHFFKLIFMNDNEKDLKIITSTLAEHQLNLLNQLSEVYKISAPKAQEVYEKSWIFCHGMATLLANKYIILSDDQIREWCTDAINGMLRDLLETPNTCPNCKSALDTTVVSDGFKRKTSMTRPEEKSQEFVDKITCPTCKKTLYVQVYLDAQR